MTFIQSSSTEYMSMYVTGRSTGDALGAMQTPVLVKAGQAAYGATFDSSPYRAGDYSGITVDPADGSFWAANEYATTSGTRGQLGHLADQLHARRRRAGPDATLGHRDRPQRRGDLDGRHHPQHHLDGHRQRRGDGVDLAYSTDGGLTFTPIATGLANTGSYAWTVPNTPTTTAIVRVVASDAAGNTGEDVSNAAFTIAAPDTTAPTVTVTSPNGGESWAAGSVHNITWTATDDVAVPRSICSTPRTAASTFTPIATGLANTGSYAWTVPNTATANGFVKVVAHDGSGNIGQDLSNAAFTITAPVGNVNDIYVWDMQWSVTQRGNWITASITLFVKRDSDGDGVAEESDAPAAGVVTTLVLDHYLSGLLLSSTTFSNAKTNGNGQVTFNLKTQYGGEFHAQVTGMSKSGLTWNTGLDQNNPSCYAGAPGGGEVNCSDLFPVMEPVRVSRRPARPRARPPMLATAAGRPCPPSSS